MLKALFIDLSGVLYEGKKVISGAVAAIEKARASQLKLRFVTNTSRKTRAQLLNDLKNLGFDLQEEELFTAPVAVHAWLQEKKLRPYCLIHHNIKSEFADLLQTMPNAVVIGDDIYGDIEGAINAGLLAGLVRTGKYQTGDKNKISAAHLTFNSIIDAVDYALSDSNDVKISE
jgi:ribonucleotide monophosphatase NagD (HAD superfamily)